MVRDSRWSWICGSASLEYLRWMQNYCKLLASMGGKFIYGLISTGNIIASWNNIWQYIETIIPSENRLKPKRKLILQPSISRCENVSFREGTGINWIKIGGEHHYTSIHHQTHGWNVGVFTRTFELVFVVGLLPDYTDYVVNGSHSAMRIFWNLMLKQQLQTRMIWWNEFLFTIGSGFYLYATRFRNKYFPALKTWESVCCVARFCYSKCFFSRKLPSTTTAHYRRFFPFLPVHQFLPSNVAGDHRSLGSHEVGWGMRVNQQWKGD